MQIKHSFRKILSTRGQVGRYSHFARVYDRVMNHVDYDQWANFISRIFDLFGNGGRRIVDGGCGTATLMLFLRKKGFSVAGFDLSYDMVREARKKGGVKLWQGDLREISLRGGWDGFICIYDSIQYLNITEIKNLFNEVKKILARGGLFVFDVVTHNHVMKYWFNYSEQTETESGDVFRRSWYEVHKRILHTEVEIYSNEEKKIYCEHHIQYIYPLVTFEEAAEESGMRLVGMFDGISLRSGNENSDRVHFVFCREVE